MATALASFPTKAIAQNLNCFESLIFGEIVTCGAAGTVTVNSDGSTSSSCVTVGSAPQSRGRCTATQSFPFRPLQVNVSSSAVINSGGNSMNVTGININASGTQITQTAPFVDIPIGGVLNVGAAQAAGTYTGSLTVTAILQ